MAECCCHHRSHAVSIPQSPALPGDHCRPWMHAHGRIAALFSLQPTQMCDPVVHGHVSEALSLVICEHFGGTSQGLQKAGTPPVSGCESSAPTLCHVPGLGGLLILLKEDYVGLHPCGRRPPGANPERCLDGKWSPPGCLPPWLPAKWDFWSQAQAQM